MVADPEYSTTKKPEEKFNQECLNAFNISDDGHDRFNNDMDRKCYTHCFMKQIGKFDDQNGLVIDAFLLTVKEVHRDKATEIINHCVKVNKSENLCDWAFHSTFCVFEKFEKNKID